MAPQDLMEERRAREFALLVQLLSTVAQRPFDRQIRCEECGNCTKSLMENIFGKRVDEDQQAHEALTSEYLSHVAVRELLYRSPMFHYMPKFTYELVSCALDVVDLEIDHLHRHGAAGPPPSHRHISEAIKELANTARGFFKANRYLAFSRIAEPLLHIMVRYFEVCDRGGVPEKERAAVQLAAIDDMSQQLVRTQEASDDWTEVHRLRRQEERRRLKRIWSGGTCLNLVARSRRKASGRKTAGGSVDAKVVCFTRSSMVIYSPNVLEEGVTYESSEAHLNRVDLPLEIAVEVDPGESEALNGSLACRGCSDIVTGWGFPFRYVLRFKDRTPYPQYYFRSMCRDLLEHTIEWSPNVFAEMFLGDFGHLAAMVR